jgi:hypothetical protein
MVSSISSVVLGYHFNKISFDPGVKRLTNEAVHQLILPWGFLPCPEFTKNIPEENGNAII